MSSPPASTPAASKKVSASLEPSRSNTAKASSKDKSVSSEFDDILVPKKKIKGLVSKPEEEYEPSKDEDKAEDDDEVAEAELEDLTDTESKPSEEIPVSSKVDKGMEFLNLLSKKAVTSQPKSGFAFKAHSQNFCFNGNEKNMVVKDLNDELFEKNSIMFKKVYVPGHRYSFIPTKIAKILKLPLIVQNDSIDFAKDQVLSELVGQTMVWEPNTTLKVTDFTHYYVVLHKFSINNWVPTTHTSIIPYDTTFFLFKIGAGVKIDLSSLIFDQITDLGNAKAKGQYLFFSHLIYKLLDSQQPLKLEYETLTPAAIGPNYKVKEESSTAKKTKGLDLKSDVLDSALTDLAVVKSTLGNVHIEVSNLQNCLLAIEQFQRTIFSRLPDGPST
ncbi:uncharacterized protein LOC133796131 [Humulus lupulus]|uniref:uncharacterized protein LOC133796131 n=1 Tax=Humulus lupulus TaxID=3486 RepID=UPI002B40E953|nr:uncharacterized protein LOC133796131 [Humulus lupulus]